MTTRLPQRFRRLRACALVLVMAVSTAACGKNDEPTAPVLAPCPGTPSVDFISAGLTPTFTWAGNCAVSGLIVATTDNGEYQDQWHIETRGLPGVPSGIRYGAAPRGATVVVRAAQLRAGREYGVWTLHRGLDGRLYRGGVYAGFVP